MYNGIINIYKEKGYTSFDVVAKLRGILHQKKIGHTGTLDPDAEGVLPVCLGKATKVCDLLTDKDKEYEAVLLLGRTTDTQDLSGTILTESSVTAGEEAVRQVIMGFVGDYDQIPPMYSALKVNGRKLCDLAREGITVERKARQVHIYDIDILEMQLPRVRMRVHCSKGTYIRTLCQDIGERIGCGGCMESLIRIRVADFRIEDAVRLTEVNDENVNHILRSIDSLFTKYPKANAIVSANKFLVNGNKIPENLVLKELQSSEMADCGDNPVSPENGNGIPREASFKASGSDIVRMYHADGRFVGLYEYQQETREYKPIRIFWEV